MKKDYCEVQGMVFHYDRKVGIVERVVKATQQELDDNARWQAKYGKELWDISPDGYIVLNRVGLRRENWDNKEAREEYLSEWAHELESEDEELVEMLAGEFKKGMDAKYVQ